MPVYLCALESNSKYCGIITGENTADAVLKYDNIWCISQDEGIEAAGSLNAYCEELLTQYEVTELNRATVLKYIKRFMDGDNSIFLLLGFHAAFFQLYQRKT